MNDFFLNLLYKINKYFILEMELNGNDIVSSFQYNDSADVLTPKHTTTTKITAPVIQHRVKNKKARFFEQFCEYISYFI